MRDEKRTTPNDRTDESINERDDTRHGTDAPNPPRTTTHGITTPKFGSAGSGGAELEPGPERD